MGFQSKNREYYDRDRLSLATNLELGRALFFARQYDSAEKQFRETLELDSTSLRAHMHLGQVLVAKHRFDDAIAELKQSCDLSRNSSRPLALLAHAYAMGGGRREAVRLLDTLRARARRAYVPAFDFAIVHAGLGSADSTGAWLSRAIDDHSIRPYLMDATFDTVRSRPEVRAVLARLRVPDTSALRGPLALFENPDLRIERRRNARP